MKRVLWIVLMIVAIGALVALIWLRDASTEAPVARLTEESARGILHDQPLVFQENKGQVDAQVLFLSRIGSNSIYFTDNRIVYQLVDSSNPNKGVVFEQSFVAGQSPYAVTGMGLLSGKINYFIGNDASKWVKEASAFSAVHYDDVYDGVDVTFDGAHGRLDYTIEIEPAVDPRMIQMDVAGVESLAMAVDGSLVFVTALGNLGLPKPIASQSDQSVAIDVAYEIIGTRRFGFQVGTYDHSRPLTITSISTQ